MFVKNEKYHRPFSIDDLLRYMSNMSYPKPESFKLFSEICLEDLFPPRGERPVPDRAEQVRFRYVLCKEGEILAVSPPCFRLPDGTQEELAPEDLAALRAAGLPLHSDLLSPDGELERDPAPSGWRLPYVPLPCELDELLAAKKLVKILPYKRGTITTQYGNRAGLCSASWYTLPPPKKGDFSYACNSGLFCTANGWVRLWEQPWHGVPDWTTLSLDIRLERLKAGRACNPGHGMAAIRALEAMPVAPILSKCLKDDYIQENLAKLQSLYGSGVTYGQAARKIAELLDSFSEEKQDLGYFGLINLATIFHVRYEVRCGYSWIPKRKKEKIEASGNKPESRSLSARLARAGIPENGTELPLVWDNLEDVLQGLCRLAGTDAPALEFYEKTMPNLPPDWAGHRWDGSFDGIISRLLKENGTDVDQALRQLLIEPFCMLDQIRRLEEEHSGLLEEIREQNKALKRSLERMTSDVKVR